MRHRVADEDALGHPGALRDERAQAGEPPGADPAEVLAAHPDVAARQPLQPGGGPGERRLAGAVGPDDRDELAGVRR